uniref:BTB domain-containing protein n=1 Tax=Strigamia maritima TaxID=126957 RepID=T1J2P3_STRMM
MTAESAKLQKHLNLLREQYVKLQKKYYELEKNYSMLSVSKGSYSDNSFVSRLLNFVADLFDKDLYSDMTVQLDGCQVRAHRFVLAARSDMWGVSRLADVDNLDFTDIPYKVGSVMLKWVYTDEVEFKEGDAFILELMTAANRYKLTALIERCEQALVSSVNVSNCIKFYTTADEIGAEILKNHCSEMIANHWDDFHSEDFTHMPAPLLYKMFKTKTEFPLHFAIRMKREDVVFLYLVEFTSQLKGKLDEVDNKDDLPLDLALMSNQTCDELAAIFLINHNASVGELTPVSQESSLHLIASCSNDKTLTNVAKLILEHGADPNKQDSANCTVLHRCIAANNKRVFQLVLNYKLLDLEKRNSEDETVLWAALQAENFSTDADSFASQLVARGSDVNAVNNETSDSLLQWAAKLKNEKAAIFLVNNGANPNYTNKKGETPLHTACEFGLARLSEALLRAGANPNLQTFVPNSSHYTQDEEEIPLVYKQTPLHLAIIQKHENVIRVILEHKAYSQRTDDNKLIVPNFNVRNSHDQTALGFALLVGLHKVAQQLLAGGADINIVDAGGLSLLHHAILNQDMTGAVFLLDNGADPSLRTKDRETPLQLAIKRHLPRVVDLLCAKNVDMSVVDENNNCPLWVALETGQEEIASILVKYKCDPDFWSEGPDSCYQTLLHRAIDENNEAVACFLIRSNCDVDTPRRPGLDGRGGDEANDLQTPLHLASAWGLDTVVQTLLEQNANVNAKDSEGLTPIHVAITNQHPTIIALLLSHPSLDLSLRDRQGLSPFALAMITKNNKAAQAILDREPTAAEQFDNKGRNFLHLAIQKCDIESVLFIISINANIHSRVRDSSHLAPIHLAVHTGNEIILRNLILAGANVNELTPQKQTSLHLAAEGDHSTLCTILIENGVDYNKVDDNLNNALHVAVQKGNLASVRVLLTESQINAECVNLKGQNPFHVLCQYSRDNAAAIFELFLECMPEYPINKPDAEGSTGLLLAYIKGNGLLCRAIVKAGACLGVMNKYGKNIFNTEVATKQLLCRLLDFLSQEPPWGEGDVCTGNECFAKFGITTRKHHCRHCGRLLCSRCSDKEMPIIKYNLNKPVRV